MKVRSGQKFRLLRDFGNQEYDPVGGVRHGLAAGAVGTFSEMVRAEEQGAHNTEEDAFVLTFEDEARSLGRDGKVVTSPVSRRISFGVQDFDPRNPDRLFEAVK